VRYDLLRRSGTIYSDATVLFHPTQRYDFADVITKGNLPLKEFAIAGANKKFVWANAEIVGNSVKVWSDKIEKPVAVRYAWADNPENVNLYNKEGLPASPFRTDNW
jgi:sialate O-acetylesterase